MGDIAMHERRLQAAFLLLPTMLLVAGNASVASAQQQVQQQVQQSGQSTQALQATVQASDTVPDFVRRAASAHAQPGDRVWFHVWREPKLSDTVMVDERGDVMLPKIGIVNASALSIGALRDTVRARIAEFLRDSPIELVVLRRVSINGEVAKPNVYYVDVTTTVRDLIARAGGVTDAGNANNVVVIRDGHRIPVRDWQRDRSESSDLRSGDQVVVARKSWLSMNALPALSVMTGVVSLVVVLFRR
jgi:protein involved in polysaccharide export with SLBB domain